MVQTNLFLQWLLSKICKKRKSEILCTLPTTQDRVSNVRSQGSDYTPHETTPTVSRSTDPSSLMRISSTSTPEKEKGDEDNQIYGGESRKKE